MKNVYKIIILPALLSITIPIETKISIPKLPPRVSSFLSKSKEEIIHQEFNNIKNLDIECFHGNVTIKTWKQSCVLVELKKRGSTLFLQNVILNAKDKDHQLSVSTALQDPTIKGTLSLHILVPESMPIKVTTTAGSIIIKDIMGPINLESKIGSITILNGNGNIQAHTSQGNIELQRATMTPGQNIKLSSFYGNITVITAQETQCDFLAQTKQGKIHSDLFVTLHPQTVLLNDETIKKFKHEMRGSIGQPIQNETPAIMMLSSEFGIIDIVPHPLKKKQKQAFI